jgi:hypothetical protein
MSGIFDAIKQESVDELTDDPIYKTTVNLINRKGVEISVKVFIDFEDHKDSYAIIRRVERNDEGHIVSLSAITASGKWLPKKEGEAYHPDCRLPIICESRFHALMHLVNNSHLAEPPSESGALDDVHVICSEIVPKELPEEWKARIDTMEKSE